MRRLMDESDASTQPIEGVPMQRDGARALIWPDDADPIFHLHVEGQTAEATVALRQECESRVRSFCEEPAT